MFSFASLGYSYILYLPFLHQLVATDWMQVDQKCPVGSIFSHIYIQSRFNEINKLDNYVMDVIGEVVQRYSPLSWSNSEFLFSVRTSLDASFYFNILGRLLRQHAVLRMMIIIDPGIFRVILGMIAGGIPENPLLSHTPMGIR